MSETPRGNNTNQEHSDDLFETRFEKLQKLILDGKSPYQLSFKRVHTVSQVESVLEKDISDGDLFTIAGRVRSRRMMGKAGFMDVEDETGRLQLYGAGEKIGEDFELFKTLDIGDIIGVTGIIFFTKTGQRSLRLHSIQLLSKCLRPLPVVKEADGKVFDAFADKEQRYRLRYVDLIVNADVHKTFILRSKIIAHIRKFLTDRGYLEVETPMMQQIPGGAVAKPFVTHHNALGMDLFLRIAPELYLKRLLVGGFTKVFELNRNFRNEGISYKHNPEFTMLELYEAYGDMESMLRCCEEMIVSVAQEINGNLSLTYENNTVDLTPPWRRVTYLESIKEFAGIDFSENLSLDEAKNLGRRAGIDEKSLSEMENIWQVAEAIFDEKVEKKLIQPIFITHFPKFLSPLAKTQPDNPNFVERFEPYIAARELGNAFSELNDPIDQKERFEMQARERESGRGDGGYVDHDYIRALEYGMPPAGGLGIGIDRLVMLLTNKHNIKDTILFPLLRPEKQE